MQTHPWRGKNPIKQEIHLRSPVPQQLPAQPSPPSISWEGVSALQVGSTAQVSRLRFPGAVMDIYTISLMCYIAKRCISCAGAIVQELAWTEAGSSYDAYGSFSPA